MAEAERVFVRIPRDTYYLCLIRKVVVELARRVGFPLATTAEIEMAVDEACSNAIRHAAPSPSPPSWIEVEARVDACGLAVTVIDGGAPFPFERSGTSDLDAYLAHVKQGGLGVYIMKHFMDEVTYRHRPDVGNELQMVKYLVRAPQAAASRD